jgi:hypothetical protein
VPHLDRIFPSVSFIPPPDALGADLFWWREGGGMHTLVTVHSLGIEGVLEDATLQCVLFDSSGEAGASWTTPLRRGQCVVIDSARIAEWTTAPPIESGVLAVYVKGRLADETGIDLRGGATYLRLYSMIDWYSDAGDIAALHNDQSITRGRTTPDLITEIGVLESPRDRNSLVFVNGEELQVAGSLTLTATNSGGASRSATYGREMRPFTAHKVQLAELFPGLDGFGGGEQVNVSGSFEGRGLFTRPYVLTEGAYLSAYHGGDVYDFSVLPAIHFRLLGAGEVNPMAVVHRPGEIETSVNFFNSHSTLEESFWVDAELFDEGGRSVARREKWRCAKRHALIRADVSELIPDPREKFGGHIALTFTPADVAEYPRRLQALLEYRSPVGAAHVMAWSDEWNSRLRLHRRAREGALPLRSYYRAIVREGLTTFISVTNAGHGGYREQAPLSIALVNRAGERRVIERTLEPYATLFESVPDLFPGADQFLAPIGVGVIEVESIFDLANVQLTRSDRSGAWAAEHFLAALTRVDERIDMPAGG